MNTRSRLVASLTPPISCNDPDGCAMTRSPAMYSRIVFWEPCVSPHKSAFIQAVAQQFGPDVQVSYIAHEGLPEDRRSLG